MNVIARLRPIHLVVCGGFIAVIAAAALVIKAILVADFEPTTTYDADGVAIIDGPYSYDNALLDNIVIYGIYTALAVLIVAWIWSRKRLMY